MDEGHSAGKALKVIGGTLVFPHDSGASRSCEHRSHPVHHCFKRTTPTWLFHGPEAQLPLVAVSVSE